MVSDLSQQVTRQSAVIEFVLVEIGLESLTGGFVILPFKFYIFLFKDVNVD